MVGGTNRNVYKLIYLMAEYNIQIDQTKNEAQATPLVL